MDDAEEWCQKEVEEEELVVLDKDVNLTTTDKNCEHQQGEERDDEYEEQETYHDRRR